MNTGNGNAVIKDEFEDNVSEVKQETRPLTWKDFRALKKSNYNKEYEKYDKSFVLFNKKTCQIADIRALNSCHACKFIGWRPRHVKLITVEDIASEGEKDYTEGSSENQG